MSLQYPNFDLCPAGNGCSNAAWLRCSVCSLLFVGPPVDVVLTTIAHDHTHTQPSQVYHKLEEIGFRVGQS